MAITTLTPPLPTYGSTGVGKTWTSGNDSWLQTISGDTLLVGLTHLTVGPAPTLSIVSNGQNIPLVGSLVYLVSGGNWTISIYRLQAPPQGSQTIACVGGAGNQYFYGNSVSYNNTGSLGNTSVNLSSGTAISQTAPAAVTDLVFNVISGFTSVISTYNQTQRSLQPYVGGINIATLIGDASISATSVPFTATLTPTGIWASISVPIHSLSTIVITGSAPSLTTVLRPSGATVSVTGSSTSVAKILRPAAAPIAISGGVSRLAKVLRPGSPTIVFTGGVSIRYAVPLPSPSQVSSIRNLEPGQFQIGDLILGEYTPFSVEDLTINGYEVNAQDFQNNGSSELNFGQDSKKPGPIQMTINVRVNRLLPNIIALVNDSRDLNFSNDKLVDDLQREWRADEVVSEWGAVKPLLFCSTDGIVRQFMGRPGKFSYKLHRINRSENYICTAEFRRSDTFGWGVTEYYVASGPEDPFTVLGTNGNASGHCRFVIFGPVNHPVINFGSTQLELDFDILEGDAVEISSYSWQRRIINLEGYSLASYLIADRPYLEEIILPCDASTVISWTGTDPGENAQLIFFWRNCYQMLK